jgi:hypothetical protein
MFKVLAVYHRLKNKMQCPIILCCVWRPSMGKQVHGCWQHIAWTAKL